MPCRRLHLGFWPHRRTRKRTPRDEPRRSPRHCLRSGLSLRLRRLARPPGGPRRDPVRASRGEGRGHRRWYRRGDLRLRTDAPRHPPDSVRIGPVRRPPALAAFRGRRWRDRRAWRHALPGLFDRLLQLCRQAGAGEPAFPEPADPRRRIDRDRPCWRKPLRRDAGRSAAAFPRGCQGLQPRPRRGGQLLRPQGRHPSPR